MIGVEIETFHKSNVKRPTVTVLYRDERMSLRKLAQREGIPHSTITARYRRGVRGNALIDTKGIRRLLA